MEVVRVGEQAMPHILVVGGHTRNIGKTQLVVEIIRAFPEARWTAAKITQYGHGICSVNGTECGCAVDEHTFAVDEETDRSCKTDTSRFLVAGAARAFWVRTKQGRLAETMPSLRQAMASAENVILESNTVLNLLRPDLYLPVLDFSNSDFKPSARAMLDRADAYVVLEPTPASDSPHSPRQAKPQQDIEPPGPRLGESVRPTSPRQGPRGSVYEMSRNQKLLWQDVSLKPLTLRPVFSVRAAEMCSPALADFIRQRFFAEARTRN